MADPGEQAGDTEQDLVVCNWQQEYPRHVQQDGIGQQGAFAQVIRQPAADEANGDGPT